MAQQMTFSQTVQATVSSVQETLKICPGLEGKFSLAMVRSHARRLLAKDGSPNAPPSLLDPVVHAARMDLLQLQVDASVA